jgi:hypothetical protein
MPRKKRRGMWMVGGVRRRLVFVAHQGGGLIADAHLPVVQHQQQVSILTSGHLASDTQALIEASHSQDGPRAREDGD